MDYGHNASSPAIIKTGKMVPMQRILSFLLIFFTLFLVGCQEPVNLPSLTTPLPSLAPEAEPMAEANPEPTLLPTANPTPTLLPEPVQLTATVWEDLPQVPILMYHRFNPNPGVYVNNYTTNLADFDWHLCALYDAGFSLVALGDWLQGNIQLQDGRRPLIITFDDLFYADQISLDEAGNPAPYSGVGRLWAFSQEHPDFNFTVALFYNLGDKGYANHYANGVFTVQEGWRGARAEAIAWGIEHGAIPLNHFYDHPFLNKLAPAEIRWQLEENERALREALSSVGRQDLAKYLPNILALPYVVWPATEEGKQVLFDYLSPEGAPVAAIVEGDSAASAKLFQAPFAEGFNRWHVPRIAASSEAIAVILEMADQIPAASHCDLGEFLANPHVLPNTISAAITARVTSGTCPYGYYVVDQWAFYVHEDGIIQYTP